PLTTVANGTRSKADSDRKQKIDEVKYIWAYLYNDDAERREYVRERLEAFDRDEEAERILAKKHELALNAIRQEILEIRQRYSTPSLKLNITQARQDQEAEESKIKTHVQTGYSTQTDAEVADKEETTTPDAPHLDQSLLSAQPNSPAQSNSPPHLNASIQPMPSIKPQPRKAPIQQSALHKNCNHLARKPHHNQNNQAHRDCNDSTRGNKPNRACRDCNNSMRSHKPNRQKQQAPQTISVMTAVPEPMCLISQHGLIERRVTHSSYKH
ncbi:UBX domain-containing protein 1-A, partial [Biomphalaria pfeifferi]